MTEKTLSPEQKQELIEKLLFLARADQKRQVLHEHARE